MSRIMANTSRQLADSRSIHSLCNAELSLPVTPGVELSPAISAQSPRHHLCLAPGTVEGVTGNRRRPLHPVSAEGTYARATWSPPGAARIRSLTKNFHMPVPEGCIFLQLRYPSLIHLDINYLQGVRALLLSLIPARPVSPKKVPSLQGYL